MPILTPQERVGTVVDGKYRLDRILGEGGFGVVYAAVHLRLARPVAVKFLHATFSQSEEVVARFMREAQATSRLSHPNVVDVRDVEVASDGGVYMVLELLEGESLSVHLARERRLGFRATLDILGPVMEALATAHEAGIVHRDVKPDNVFLSRAGGRTVPKILDFGIAKLADQTASRATATGSVLGTPMYMAPEQAMGRIKEIGPGCDVWSMAVMFYECLSGTVPFEIEESGSAAAVLYAVMTAPVVPLPFAALGVPASVAPVLARALERSVTHRTPSMRELHAALTAIAQDQREVLALETVSELASAPTEVRPEPVSTTPPRSDAGWQATRITPPSWKVAPNDAIAVAAHAPSGHTHAPAAGPTPRSGRARMWLVFAASVGALGLAMVGASSFLHPDDMRAGPVLAALPPAPALQDTAHVDEPALNIASTDASQPTHVQEPTLAAGLDPPVAFEAPRATTIEAHDSLVRAARSRVVVAALPDDAPAVAMPAPEVAVEDLRPETLSREQVLVVIQALDPVFDACRRGSTSSVTSASFAIHVSGATGRATIERIPFGVDPHVAVCIQRAIESRAQFPEFRSPVLRLVIPLRV